MFFSTITSFFLLLTWDILPSAASQNTFDNGDQAELACGQLWALSNAVCYKLR